MSSIDDWLAQLGLERYAEAFAKADVDFDTLRDLTDADLQSLGLSLGHRKKLFKAIASDEFAVPVAPPLTAAANSPSRIPLSGVAEPERRQLSMAFCDLVGSTALAAQLDPEDAREVLQAYQRCCAEVVERFVGSISQMQGDGIMIRFGYPQAHEDDAERAVGCALELVAAVAKLTTRQNWPLKARVGVASGPVVVGDRLIATNEQGTSGSAPNLAARLQGVAEPGQVVIDALTRQLVAGAFTTLDLGAHDLKGFAEPMPVFLVRGVRSSDSRFASRHADAPMPLIGREHELGLLLHRWQAAEAGEGQVVLLIGEPGYGKSRLVAELQENLSSSVFKVIWQCSPHRTNTALYPAIENLTRAAGIQPTDPPDIKRAKLERQLGASSDVPILADLLSIPEAGDAAHHARPPAERKQQILDALLGRLKKIASQGPACLVVEDMHWIDPTTMELIDLAVDAVQRALLLLILTFRPEFTSPWGSRGHVTTLTLNRMSKIESSQLSVIVAGQSTLPADMLERIVERADGVPLFVEELTRSTIESGAVERSATVGPSTWAAELIPSSLQSSLVARLDRLSAVKEIAQIAAVIGREFQYDLLASVAEYDPVTLERALDALVSADIVHRRGGQVAPGYAFKHALIQDAAYGSLLRPKRRLFHLRIADAIEAHFPQRCATEPEVLAHHLTEAAEDSRAVVYWLKAATRAADRSAAHEVVGHTAQGLALIRTIAPSDNRDQLEMALLSARLFPATHVYGFSSDELQTIYKRLRALRHEGADPQAMSLAFYGEFLVSITQANMHESLEINDVWTSATRDLPDRNPFYHALRCRAYAKFLCGDFTKMGNILASLEPVDWDREGYSDGDFSAETSKANLSMYQALNFWCTGFPIKSHRAIEIAMHHGANSGRVNLRMFLLHTWTTLLLFQNDLDKLSSVAGLMMEAGRDYKMPNFLACGRAYEAVIEIGNGRHEVGSKRLAEAFVAMDRIKYYIMRPHLMCWLADGLAAVNGVAAGLSVLDQSISMIDKTGQELFRPVVETKRGEFYEQSGDLDAAVSAFDAARIAAARQGALMLELDAASRLAGIWQNVGRIEEAAGLLRPLLASVTEGFDTDIVMRASELARKLCGVRIDARA